MVQAVQITMKIPSPKIPEKRMKQSNVLKLCNDDQKLQEKRMIGFLVLKNEIENEKMCNLFVAMNDGQKFYIFEISNDCFVR